MRGGSGSLCNKAREKQASQTGWCARTSACHVAGSAIRSAHPGASHAAGFAIRPARAGPACRPKQSAHGDRGNAASAGAHRYGHGSHHAARHDDPSADRFSQHHDGNDPGPAGSMVELRLAAAVTRAGFTASATKRLRCGDRGLWSGSDPHVGASAECFRRDS